MKSRATAPLPAMLDHFRQSHAQIAKRLKQQWVSHHRRVSGRPPPSGLKITVYRSFATVPLDHWNACNAKQDVFLSSDYLTALELAPPSKMQFRYVIFSKGATPTAIAYFQILELGHQLHRTARDLLPATRKPALAALHDRLVGHLSHRVLVCGNALLSGEHGYAAAAADERQVLHAIAEAAYAIKKAARFRIAATLVKDFADRCDHPTDVFAQFGYHPVDAGPNLIVPIRETWRTFDGYLKAMKSKYRRKVADAVKKGAKIQRRSLGLEEIIQRKSELYALYAAVVDQAKFRPFFLSPDFFVELKRGLGDRFVCDAYLDGPTLVGFTTRIFNGREMEGYAHGVDYALNKSFELYQNFMLDDIRAGIAAGCTRINTGRTSIAMKSSVGAVPETMKCYLRFSGKLSNQLIKPLLQLIKPGNEHCRRPFDDDETPSE